MNTSTLDHPRETSPGPTGESAGELASLFDALREGVIVGATSHRQGVVRLVVENKYALGRIADSWQRLVVTLTGCDTFKYEPSAPGARQEDPKTIGARALRIRAARCESGLVRIVCDTPLGSGVLQVTAASFALMLGGGRTISASALLKDLIGTHGN